MWIWGRVRCVDGAVLFSPFGVFSARVRAMRCTPMLDGSVSDAVASTSMCLLNFFSVPARSLYKVDYSFARAHRFKTGETPILY